MKNLFSSGQLSSYETYCKTVIEYMEDTEVELLFCSSPNMVLEQLRSILSNNTLATTKKLDEWLKVSGTALIRANTTPARQKAWAHIKRYTNAFVKTL